jgi:hypothetical protein
VDASRGAREERQRERERERERVGSFARSLNPSTRLFLSLAGAVPPAHLAAADLPGNRGFDPMCLGADPKALAW